MNQYVKSVLAIALLIIVGGISGYFLQNGKQSGDSAYEPELFQPSYNRVISSEPFQQLYTNPDYGFSFVLNESWKDYRVFSDAEAGDIISYYFCVKTSDPTWQSDTAGYACPLYLSVLRDDEWEIISQMNLEQSQFELWGIKDGYRVIAEIWSQTPADLSNLDFGFTAMKESFRW